MYLDDLSLLSSRLSHDVFLFLKWVKNFQVLSPQIFNWGLLLPCCRFKFLPLVYALPRGATGLSAVSDCGIS